MRVDETPQNVITPRALKVEDVARELRVSPGLVRKEIRAGALNCVRVGRLMRVPASELDRYLGENK